MTDTITSSPWLRRIGLFGAALMIFGIGWSQGELASTQRLADALRQAAPATIQIVRDACPRELTDKTGWSQSCFDLLPLTYFLPGETK